MAIADISLPEVIIPDAPTAEELDDYIKLEVGRRAYGHYVDEFKIQDCPKELHYEWHPVDNSTTNRLASLGYVRNDALAARSKFLNPDKTEGNMIQDVALYTIRTERKQALDKALEISKQIRLDPRKDYDQIANQHLDSSYERLKPKDVAENKRTIMSGAEAQLAMAEDQLSARKK